LLITSCSEISTKVVSTSPSSTNSPINILPSPVVTTNPTNNPIVESVKPSLTPTPTIPVPTNSPIINNEEQRNLTIKSIIDNRCAKCHSGIKLGGYDFKELNDVINSKSAIKGVVKSGRMPSGNVTGMTQEERNSIESW